MLVDRGMNVEVRYFQRRKQETTARLAVIRPCHSYTCGLVKSGARALSLARGTRHDANLKQLP